MVSAFEEVGLGVRLIREVLAIASALGLTKLACGLLAQREREPVCAAERVGFKEVATLENRVKKILGQLPGLYHLGDSSVRSGALVESLIR